MVLGNLPIDNLSSIKNNRFPKWFYKKRKNIGFAHQSYKIVWSGSIGIIIFIKETIAEIMFFKNKIQTVLQLI